MCTLLKHSSYWWDNAETFLNDHVDLCGSFCLTKRPQTCQKVSLASIHQQFEDLVCVDQKCLDEIRLFHAMDSQTRYSVGSACHDLTLVLSYRRLKWFGLVHSEPCCSSWWPSFNHPELNNMLTTLGHYSAPHLHDAIQKMYRNKNMGSFSVYFFASLNPMKNSPSPWKLNELFI